MATSLRALAVHFSTVLFLTWAGKVATQTSAFPGTTDQFVTDLATADRPVTEPVTTDGRTTESPQSPTPESVSIGTAETDVTSAMASTKPRVFPTEVATAAPADDVSDCACDITPRFCDIGCCCDAIDCNVTDLGSVFTGCQAEESYAVCVESWLVFRGNVDPALVTVNESLFCVRQEAVDAVGVVDKQSLPAVPSLPKLQDSYSFSLQDPPFSSLTGRTFYKVDDVILTHYSRSSAIGMFRQPSAGGATSLCVDRNPAPVHLDTASCHTLEFLRSGSLFCSRSVTRQSCLSDPSLSARSYFSDISLLKAPAPQNVSVPGFTVTIMPLSEWPEPQVQDGSCLDVVSKVEYVLQYTSGGTLTMGTVNVTLTTSKLDVQLLQQHAVQYQLATPPPTTAPPLAIGIKLGAPLTGRFGSDVQPLTVQGVSQGGDCSASPHARTPVLFQHNYITGCTLRSVSPNCSALRAQLYGILQGVSTPDAVAMNAGWQPDWTRVTKQDCPRTPPPEGIIPDTSCNSGCLVPLSLSVHVLWAKRGLLSVPHNQILGARFLFHCQSVKCPLDTPLTVTTEVKFADATVYPTAPKGRPQPRWKLPFGLLRGADQPVLNRGACCSELWGSTAWLIGFILSVTIGA